MTSILLMLLAAAGGGRLEPLPELPDRQVVCPADPSRLGDVGFDARSGERFGPQHLAAKDTLSIVIHNKNPFLYAYRRNVTSAPTDVSLPLEFLKALKVGVALPGAERTGLQKDSCDPVRPLLEKLSGSVDAFQKVAGDPKSDCAALFGAARPVQEDGQAFVARWNQLIEPGCTLPDADQKKLTAALQAAARLLAAFKDVRSFTDTTLLSIPDEPTTVTVELFRTRTSDASPREEKVFGAQVEVGTSRVSLSVGGAWLSLPTRTVVRQAQRQPDGSSLLAFGYSEDSASHFALTLLLHGAIVELPPFAFMPRSEITATLGAAIPVAEPAGDFILGLSWAFSRTVYLDLGFEFGKVTSIAGGFKEGDPVPTNLADPLPTTQSWAVGGTVGLSWRIK